MKKQRVSMATVAQEAGVSKSVVYTVLRNKQGNGIYVGEKTRERVLAASKKLGYVASKSAQSLYSGKANTIAIIGHRLIPSFAALLECLQRQAFKAGQDILPLFTGRESAQEEQYLDLLRDGRADGVIVIGATLDGEERYKRFAAAPNNLNIVTLGSFYEGVPGVQTDKSVSAALAVDHFQKLGCQQPAFVTMYEGNALHQEFDNAVKQQYSQGTQVFCSKSPEAPREKRIEEAVNAFFQTENLPDAVLTDSDCIASLIVDIAKERKLKIPEQLSIIARDDSELCQFRKPALTSLVSDYDALACELLKLMACLVDDKPLDQSHVSVPTKLIKRDS